MGAGVMASLPSETTDNLSQGMYDAVAPTRFPKGACALIYNGRIQPDGTVKRRSGSIRTTESAANADIGYGGSRFTTAGGADQIVVCLGANAYSSADKGATLTERETGLPEAYYDFAEMRIGATNYLYLANGDTSIHTWSGAAWSTATNAPSGAKYIEPFNGRLWATGHSGVLVVASKIADTDVWATPDGLTVQADALPTGLGSIGTHLLVFTRRSTNLVDGFGEQTLVVGVGSRGFSEAVGCIAFRSIQKVGDDALVWLSERGVEYYSPSTGIVLVSKSVQTFLNTIDYDQIYNNPGRVTSAYKEETQDYFLALSTDGIRNNRVLVLNLRTNVDDQRPGKRAAASIDRYQSPTSGDLLFAVGTDGYLEIAAGGAELDTDDDGYIILATEHDYGWPIALDADGYLEVVTNDTLPASLFISPATDEPNALYSLGYDGFVRRHSGVASDDMLSAGTGGTAVAMTVRSKPFLLGQIRQKKRVRIAHIASIQSSAATLSTSVKGGGTSTAAQDITMSALGSGAAYRTRMMTKMDADNPQVEVVTTDDVQISMLGISAKLLRERA